MAGFWWAVPGRAAAAPGRAAAAPGSPAAGAADPGDAAYINPFPRASPSAEILVR
jgi:hypothetical protein